MEGEYNMLEFIERIDTRMTVRQLAERLAELKEMDDLKRDVILSGDGMALFYLNQ